MLVSVKSAGRANTKPAQSRPTRTHNHSRAEGAQTHKPSSSRESRNSNDGSKISFEATLSIKGEGCGARDLLNGLNDAFGGCNSNKDRHHHHCHDDKDKRPGQCGRDDQKKKSGGCGGGQKAKKGGGGQCGGGGDPAKKLQESLEKCRSARCPKQKQAARSELANDYQSCKESKAQLDLKLEMEVVMTLAGGGGGGGPRRGQRVA